MTIEAREKEDFQTITRAMRPFPEGLSFYQLHTLLAGSFTASTLHRRLKKLHAQGSIRITGQVRSTIYHLVATADPAITHSIASSSTPATITTETTIHLSPEAAAVQALITQPVGNRPPVSYVPEFLRQYQPNKDFYLTADERIKLHQLGVTAQLTQAAGTYARLILQRLLIDLSFNSSRLEGNNYSLLDTKRLLEEGKAADRGTAEDAQMILNHKEAIEFIVDAAAEIGFNRYTITNLHALLADNLLGDPAAAGRIRSIPVDIGHSVYIPLAIPQLINELFDLLLEKAAAIEDPFEQAFFIMVQLPYLQPFDDVNKRVSRLAANIPLIKKNLAPLSFVDVPREIYAQGLLAVYELQRVELFKAVFLWSYERSAQRYAALRQSMGEPDVFRLKYREDIRTLVQQVITNTLSLSQAKQYITTYAETVDIPDRKKFIEVVETELLSLHDGNFARYKVTPATFRAWAHHWNNP
jgi:Fic family protein